MRLEHVVRIGLFSIVAFGAGCTTVSLRVIDAKTRQPISNAPVRLWIRHGDMMDFLMMLPAHREVDAATHTDAEGRAIFKNANTGDGSYFTFRDDNRVPYLYFSDDRWWIQSNDMTRPADVVGGDIVIPLFMAVD